MRARRFSIAAAKLFSLPPEYPPYRADTRNFYRRTRDTGSFTGASASPVWTFSSFASDLRGPAKNRDPRAIGRIADALFFREGTYSSAPVVPKPAFPSPAVKQKRRGEKEGKKGEHRVRMAYI